MKINGNLPAHIGKIYQTYQNNSKSVDKDPVEKVGKKDSLELSAEAMQINKLIKETKDLPDIREEKIARIKEQIAKHTYNISAEQVAAKMLSKE